MPDTATVRKVRLRNTCGSRIGSSTAVSALKKRIQNSSATPSRPMIWTDAHGYVVPANEIPMIVSEDAMATKMAPRTSILRETFLPGREC